MTPTAAGCWPATGPAAESAADATLAGPADALLLLLWGRLDLDDPRIRLTGDRTAADRVLSARLVP